MVGLTSDGLNNYSHCDHSVLGDSYYSVQATRFEIQGIIISNVKQCETVTGLNE